MIKIEKDHPINIHHLRHLMNKVRLAALVCEQIIIFSTWNTNIV